MSVTETREDVFNYIDKLKKMTLTYMDLQAEIKQVEEIFASNGLDIFDAMCMLGDIEEGFVTKLKQMDPEIAKRIWWRRHHPIPIEFIENIGLTPEQCCALVEKITGFKYEGWWRNPLGYRFVAVNYVGVLDETDLGMIVRYATKGIEDEHREGDDDRRGMVAIVLRKNAHFCAGAQASINLLEKDEVLKDGINMDEVNAPFSRLRKQTLKEVMDRWQ